jgi:hypothetical protein
MTHHINNRIYTDAYKMDNLDRLSIVTDIMVAYNIESSGMFKNEIYKLHDSLRTDKLYSIIREVVFSSREPIIIMTIVSRIGMFIPPKYRIGLSTYKYFLNNIRYYSGILGRVEIPCTLPMIYMAKDRMRFLQNFRDDEIFRKEFKFSTDVKTRLDMLQKFIDLNICSIGDFSLPVSSKSIYNTPAKVIFYKEKIEMLDLQNNEKGLVESSHSYSLSEFLSLIDDKNSCIWKSMRDRLSNNRNIFSLITLLNLKSKILERLEQWRNLDGYKLNCYPEGIFKIIKSINLIELS